MSFEQPSITDALEQLALTLGKFDAVPIPELIRALERAAERLRTGTVSAAPPHDLISQAEASRLIGVSRQAVHQWVRKGNVRSYVGSNSNGRQSSMVSLAELVVVANRGIEAPFSASLRQQYLSFIDLVEGELSPAAADGLRRALEPEPTELRSGEASRVLREFVIAAMGTSSMQQEFTQAGVQMLADLSPQIVIDRGSDLGQLADSLGLMVRSTRGTAGFDSATTALLGLLGCATLGVAMGGPHARTGVSIAEAAEQVWDANWVGRLFDVAFHLEELGPSPLTRYTASLTYLGTNRYLRQAQSAGVSITYARSPGAILPESYYGDALLADHLAGRAVDPPWKFSQASAELASSSMEGSDGNAFRIFSFEQGLLDNSIHGIRRYCLSTVDTRVALQRQLSSLKPSLRTRYLDSSIARMTKSITQPYMELTAIDRLEDFDWWKDHIIRSSPREILLGLRSPRAREVAHALLVKTTMLPDVIEAAETDSSLRDRLRIYVKNLEFGIVEERYQDDVKRGISRVIKDAAESVSLSDGFTRAEAEIKALLK